ncbi:D-alanine--D-alanine ligase [Gilvimarinus polysaccharolyticus]|uniref:D-alanine--D-alanine ligase n=1 Tax=Gilvimarinus polysaccharolyticus TaxID=863921 RepID=UPI000673440A|nr:D-alanine--D-alanine ligase [Gilvimarinus polysaccharolyticus]
MKAENSPLSTQFGRVGVLFGGRSAERDISLQSGAAVVSALAALGIDHVAIDIGNHSIDHLQKAGIDRAFIALHGPGGEDGRIQAVLEYLEIPYTGSDVQASAIGMDKLRTKQLWRGIGVNTPDFTLLNEHCDWAQVLASLGGEVMVKPAHEGSSIGMARVSCAETLKAAYAEAAKFDAVVIAERLVRGSEYTVAILGDRALPAIKLETEHSFYDYDAKYLADDTRYLCPCELDAETELELQAQALRAFRDIGCRGWGRVDVMRDTAGVFQMLEVNTVPGMTDHSLVPMAAKAAGIEFSELILAILSESLNR